MPLTTDSGFDAAVVDRENHAVALVQVKADPLGPRWEEVVSRQLAKFPVDVEFVLTIDPDCIHVYRASRDKLVQIAHLVTREILQHYDSEFGQKRVFEPYLLTLVEAWLRDLAYHWKSENPPGAEELGRSGLLEKLDGGTTQPLGA